MSYKKHTMNKIFCSFKDSDIIQSFLLFSVMYEDAH
jgi:hypothetical protein